MKIRRLQISAATVLAFSAFLGLPGCVHTRSLNQHVEQSKKLDHVQAIDRPMHARLQDFGRMVRAYTGEARDVIIEVDLIPNDSGIQKELPNDIGLYAVSTLAVVGEPFRTTRSYPSAIVLMGPGGFGSGIPAPEKPKPAVKLKGQLLRASERVVKANELRADGLAAIGSGSLDIGATAERRLTVTSIRVGLYLEGPDGISLPGPTAVYELFLVRDENNASISAYWAGTGGGLGSKIQVNQDAADAMADLTAACVMKLIGHWLMVPYYRCDERMESDAELEQRFRDYLARRTRVELEETIKRYLFVDGSPMDMTSPALTEGDRVIVKAEMDRLGLNVDEIQDQAEFIVVRWKTLDYRRAAARVNEQIGRNTRWLREQAVAAAANREAERQACELRSTAFGWPVGTPFVALDLSRVSDAKAAQTIQTVVGGVSGTEELRIDTSRKVYGVRFSGKPADLQKALRRSRDLEGYEYVWTDAWGGLIVIPRR